MNISLNTNQKLSDASGSLPTQAGLYLISAGTGTGKSHYMTRQSDSKNDVVVFPQKSILAQQKTLAEQDGRSLNVLQLERFNKKTISDFESYGCSAIHIDEIQLLYEADYRAQAVSELREQIASLSKHYPVFCYSGTYINELSPVDFDLIINVQRPSSPILYDIVFTAPKKLEQGYNGITNECLQRTIVDSFHEYKRPVLFFNNDHKQNTDLSRHLEEKGLRTVCVNRDAVKDKSHVFHELAQHERISEMNVDVVLSTSALEEGINVHDEITVISVQTAPERIVQQWGRARDRSKAKFILVCGYGDSLISESKSLDTATRLQANDFDTARSRRSHGVDEQAMLIPDEKHRKSVMARAVQVTKLQRPAYAMQVIHGLSKHGFEMSQNVMEFDKSMTLSTTRVKRVDVVSAIKQGLSPEQFANQHQINLVFAELAFRKAQDFEQRLGQTAMNGAIEYLTQQAVETGQTDIVQEYVLNAFSSITESAITWLNNLNDNQLKQVQTLIQTLYDNDNVRRRDKTQMSELSQMFWDTLYHDSHDIKPEWVGSMTWLDTEYTRARQKLFCFMMGYVYDNSNGSYVLNKLDWWKSDLSRSERSSYNRKTVKVPNRVLFHQKTNLNERDILKTKPKVIKLLINDIDWGI